MWLTDGQTDGRFDFNMPPKFLRGHKKSAGRGGVMGVAKVSDFFFHKNPSFPVFF